MSRLYRSGDAYTKSFVVASSTGAAVAADSTPAGTVYVNGAASGASVAITTPATGVYKAAVSALPGAAGDVVELLIAATVGGVATKGFVDAVRLVAFNPADGARLGLTALPASGTLTVTPTLNAAQAFNNTGQTTKLAATVATGDGADAASVKATVGVAGAGLTAIPEAAFTVKAVSGLNKITLDDDDPNRGYDLAGRVFDIQGGPGQPRQVTILSSNTGTGQQTLTANMTTATTTGTSYLILRPSLSGTVDANVVQVGGDDVTTSGAVDANLVSVNGTTFSGASVPSALAAGQSAAIAAAILDLADGVESGETLRQTMRLIRAVLAGKAADAGGTSFAVKRKDGTTTAVTITHDASGNRSASVVGSLS